MWYGDPREARRAARYAARAARHAARSARWAARYGYGYRRYRRPGGGIVGLLIVLFLLLYAFHHLWVWLVLGAVALVVVGVVARAARRGMGMYNASMPYQQPQQPPMYTPYQGQLPQNASSYDQGYAARQPQESYGQGDQPYYYPPQAPVEQPYEQPQAQYPEQMPPMQQ